MTNKRGTNQYEVKHKGLSKGCIKSVYTVIFFVTFIILAQQVARYGSRVEYYMWRDAHVIAPCSNFCSFRGQVLASEPLPLTVDQMVDKYANKYGETRYQKNRIKAMIHFLLLREQNYGGSDKCGDSGLACGPLQFHQATYAGYREIMMKRGLATEAGSRLDMENSIDTCAWAISDGREGAWGPIARGEIKI